MSKTKYSVGDEVAYQGNKWVVLGESNGIVTIVRDGVRAYPKADSKQLKLI